MNGHDDPERRGAFLPDVLMTRARTAPDRVVYVFVDESGTEVDQLDHATLHRRAVRIAERLRRQCVPGDRALLAFLPGLDFIAAFFGCMYARVVAVPVAPPLPTPTAGPSAIRNVIADAQPAIVLTDKVSDEFFGETLRTLCPVPPMWVDDLTDSDLTDSDLTDSDLTDNGVVDDVPADERSAIPYDSTHAADPVDADDVALLQYTSGSTGAPKGVMVTHGNLRANQEMIRDAFGHDETSVVVGWAPFFHDQGLIGNVLQPLYVGARAVLMSPMTFIRRPLLWPTLISRYRATTSGGPDFAYAACVAHARRTGLPADLDLTSWTVAFNGAEPIRSDTIRSFAAEFAPHGFDARAMYPCYGLAESTLLVTASRPGRGPRTLRASAADLQHRRYRPDSAGTEVVGSGTAVRGSVIRIVDPDRRVGLPDGVVGEIWVSGEHVCAGYWHNRPATDALFGAIVGGGDPMLRTGDLGFVVAGELYVVGRIKDMIVIRGRNFYPTDIERATVGAHSALRPGGCAAFGWAEESSGGDTPAEEVVVVAEIRATHRDLDAAEVRSAIRAAIRADLGITVLRIGLIAAGELPKTTSGKVRRRAARALYDNDGFTPVGTEYR
ncbi:hypothetical protein GOPIP_011_01780 [Gordonia polyisoprenivorans NBRC 16320 = JCM 10675]|uniref:Fatty acyl-AMP ligase n=1 Tax=Gordonia polyisoprenivorans TaxID=84595 RepID=A0A846WNS9_9ACTN|nr:fatty acyl-AMP ligase [Gordonia polyisoprenivorans]NKY03298.1 fatty acyl-AMP ligase [Gordonia polyisoprenivorans]OZC31784.1 aminotransferase [Gordonia polyisoprenivorans]WCB36319.1 fatty acyl-AMP ligase [Gordonia polyisoprenivorans]GAB21786.1 hypothetical protein GOPIP_011_01780 [Gordonia polyisoprenivorans NBRC 16320 = JCM 10675]